MPLPCPLVIRQGERLGVFRRKTASFVFGVNWDSSLICLAILQSEQGQSQTESSMIVVQLSALQALNALRSEQGQSQTDFQISVEFD